MHILAISGSLRKESYNNALLRAFAELAPEGMTIEMADISALPLFNQDSEAAFPEAATELKKKIEASDGLIIATPEYNRSMPGVLKNAIDWASRPWGKNSFTGKPVVTCGISVGKIGTAVAQSHLRQVLNYLDAHVVGQPELYLGPAAEILHADGKLAKDETKEVLRRALEALAARVSK
ncbi:MAG TPA: NADPH-dependent FMN reductase [Candidatus Paceibacterota bacterium]|nr:NADPH-dependent FMN reductase [Candidatus Paceibacterota bacterium]